MVTRRTISVSRLTNYARKLSLTRQIHGLSVLNRGLVIASSLPAKVHRGNRPQASLSDPIAASFLDVGLYPAIISKAALVADLGFSSHRLYEILIDRKSTRLNSSHIP